MAILNNLQRFQPVDQGFNPSMQKGGLKPLRQPQTMMPQQMQQQPQQYGLSGSEAARQAGMMGGASALGQGMDQGLNTLQQGNAYSSLKIHFFHLRIF